MIYSAANIEDIKKEIFYEEILSLNKTLSNIVKIQIKH